MTKKENKTPKCPCCNATLGKHDENCHFCGIELSSIKSKGGVTKKWPTTT